MIRTQSEQLTHFCKRKSSTCSQSEAIAAKGCCREVFPRGGHAFRHPPRDAVVLRLEEMLGTDFRCRGILSIDSPRISDISVTTLCEICGIRLERTAFLTGAHSLPSGDKPITTRTANAC